MKITKSQLHKVIREELQAELNEERKLPGNLIRLLQMVTGDAGDQDIQAKINQIEDKLSIDYKLLLAATILQEFGIEVEDAALKTALTKGLAALKRQDASQNIVSRLQDLEGGAEAKVGVPAKGPSPYGGGSKARPGGIPSSARNSLDDFSGVERRA